MNILLIGPVAEPKMVNGVQTFNRMLATILNENHNLDVAILVNQLFTGKIRTHEVARLTGCGTYGIDWSKPLNFAPFDMLILSGADIGEHGTSDYKKILRAFPGPVLIWAHGTHLSGLSRLGDKELQRDNIRYVCCDELSFREAQAYGYGDKAVLLVNPTPFDAKEVKPGAGYGVIVSNLSRRKNYPDMIRVAENCVPGTPIRVYGQIKDESILGDIEACAQMEYCGTLPHDELMEEVASADFILHMAIAEGFPSLAVREANGLGVPAILPKNPLYEESVQGGNVFVDVNDLQPVDTSAMAALEARQALAGQTREKYGVEVFREGLAALIDEVRG